MGEDCAGVTATATATAAGAEVAATGIEGLDEILSGGLPRGQVYLLQGGPGAGKTTLALQFARRGVADGERVLYITMSEPVKELHRIAASHGWSLDGLDILYLGDRVSQDPRSQQTMLYPAEVELPRLMETILSTAEKLDPARIVIDSLSELRLAAREEHWFRRHLHVLRDRIASGGRTILLLEAFIPSAESTYIYSLVSGVLELSRSSPEFGPAHRRLNIPKIRGLSYDNAYHDMRLKTGGLEVYPRLIACDRPARMETRQVSSGVAELDQILGGGLDVATGTILMGPAGTGKSAVATQYVDAAARRGERSTMYLFDERYQTLYARSRGMGIDLAGHVERGLVHLHQVDPAEMSAGQFSSLVRRDVEARDVSMVVIDSLSGYVHAMPEQRFLLLHLHELLTFLNQRGVTSLMILAQHGIVGADLRPPLDISYLGDTVILFRYFEYRGQMRHALSVFKRRAGRHERTIRELMLGPSGVAIGPALSAFEGVLTGIPRFVGEGSEVASA